MEEINQFILNDTTLRNNNVKFLWEKVNKNMYLLSRNEKVLPLFARYAGIGYTILILKLKEKELYKMQTLGGPSPYDAKRNYDSYILLTENDFKCTRSEIFELAKKSLGSSGKIVKNLILWILKVCNNSVKPHPNIKFIK